MVWSELRNQPTQQKLRIMNITIYQIATIAGVTALIGWGLFFYELWKNNRGWKMPRVSDAAFSVVSLIMRDFTKMRQNAFQQARAEAGPLGSPLLADMFSVHVEEVGDRNEHKDSGIAWDMTFGYPGKSFITISGGEDGVPNLKWEVSSLLRWQLCADKQFDVMVAVV